MLLQACEEEKLATNTEGRVKLDNWFTEHKMAIVQFRIRVDDFLKTTRKNVGDSHNKNIDQLIKISLSASALAAIFRLAEKIAKIKAENCTTKLLKTLEPVKLK